jgi:hypothetical protein
MKYLIEVLQLARGVNKCKLLLLLSELLLLLSELLLLLRAVAAAQSLQEVSIVICYTRYQ